MANAARGDVTLRLGGELYVLRPSFAALTEIESALGIGLVELAERFRDRRYGVRELAAVAHAGAKAAGHAESLPELGEKLAAAGLVAVAPAVFDFVHNALSGGMGKNPSPPPAESAR